MLPFSSRASCDAIDGAERREVDAPAAPSVANSTTWLDADRRDQLARRAERDHLAVIDDRDAIAQPFGLVHVVRRQQNGAAGALELLDQIPELAPRLRVEAGRRLVEEQQVGVADERAGQREPLLLSARQRRHTRVALLLELHQRDRRPSGVGP